MPLYEYQCLKCKHRFERIMKFSDRPMTKCPDCGAKVEQMISAPAVQFKGTGWYVTDYAKSGSKLASSDNKSEKSSDKDGKDSGSKESGSKDSGSKDSNDSSSKSESKSDSKSDSSSDSKSDSSSKSDSKKSDKKK